jgi:hypothetical protein
MIASASRLFQNCFALFHNRCGIDAESRRDHRRIALLRIISDVESMRNRFSIAAKSIHNRCGFDAKLHCNHFATDGHSILKTINVLPAYNNSVSKRKFAKKARSSMLDRIECAKRDEMGRAIARLSLSGQSLTVMEGTVMVVLLSVSVTELCKLRICTNDLRP